jgi:uncharacterized protein YjdB
MIKNLSFLLILLGLSMFWSCSKKDDSSDNPAPKQYALIIKSGGQSITVGNNFNFEAQLVGTDGTIIPITSGITYSSSNTDVATFTGAAVFGKGQGTATVTATYTYNGVTYTASVPLAIQNPSTIFTVNPWTIWWEADGSEFELNTIYFGTATPSYTYSSSDASIASVTSSGVVKVLKAGSCVITVTATNLTGSPSVQVPVLVFGKIAVPLPVSQVKITPGSYEMFKGEDKVFTTKAYNGSGTEVTGKTIKWSIKTTDSTDMGEAATIDQTGKVTALRVGEAAVYAEIEGIVSQANITINPDFALFIDPFTTSIAPDQSQTFSLKTYQVDRAKYRAGAPDAITLTTNPSNVQWLLPFNNIPGFPSPFSITSSNTNSCTLKASSSATPGMPGFLLAFVNDDRYAAGGASVQVAVADDCDCGPNNPSVSSISVASTNVSIPAFFGNFAINAQAKDALGNVVSGAEIKYCSNNVMVANVDFEGNITAVSAGTAVITVCVGNVKKEINVTVN